MSTYAHTDGGNARRLVDLCGKDFRYVPKWGRFVVWNERWWEQDPGAIKMMRFTDRVITSIKTEAERCEDDEDREKLFKWAAASDSVTRRKAMVELAKSAVEAEASVDEFDNQPWKLNVVNGTIDLRTGYKGSFTKNDRLTNAAPVKFDEQAKAPLWEQFLQDALPDEEVRKFLQRYVGYSLTGSTEERMMVICVGGGRNGKSVFLRVISDLLGHYARATDPDLIVARGQESHPTGVADLYGRRLVTLSEVRKGRTWDEEKVKRFLGGSDSVKARRMFEDYWEYIPTFKLIMMANDRPRVLDASDSFWDRIALVPFNVRVTADKVDKKLVEKLRLELPGILNWALEGCRDWQAQGLNPPAAVLAASKEYRDTEDRIGRFIEDRLVLDEKAFISTEELIAISNDWCEANNIKPFSEKSLVDRLKSVPGVTSVRPRVNGEKQRGLAGLRQRKSSDSLEKRPN